MGTLEILTGAPFPRHGELVAALSDRHTARRLDDAILAPTDVTLPSGAVLVAVIEGGKAGDRITISDAGAVLTDMADTGARVTEAVRRAFRLAARRHGLESEHAQLRLGPVAIDDAAPAIALFANAARAVADAIAIAARKSSRERFRERVRAELGRIFDMRSVHPDGPLQGKSASTHRFDYVVTLDGGRQLAIDAPVPDQSSIAAVLLRQMDVRAADLPNVRQAIAYDDGDEWPTPSLAQLHLAGVSLVRAENLERGVRDVVAA